VERKVVMLKRIGNSSPLRLLFLLLVPRKNCHIFVKKETT